MASATKPARKRFPQRSAALSPKAEQSLDRLAAQRATKLAKRRALARLVLPAALAFHPFPVVNDWRDAKALREELGTLVAEAEAIAKVAQTDNRDLTDEETKRIDAILGTGEPGADSHSPGLVHNLQARIQRMERIENTRKEIVDSLSNPPVGGSRQEHVPGQGGDNDVSAQGRQGDSIIARIKVPASCQRPSTFKAHVVEATRAENERSAYALGRFAMATIAKHKSSVAWCEEHGVIKAGLTEGTPADGGYLVPTELSRAIIYIRDMYGVFRKYAKIETMTADTKDVTVKLTGLSYAFKAEGVQGEQTQPTWGNVALVAKKVFMIAKMSSELNEDAIIALGEDLANDLGEANALAEDDCGFLADGTAPYGSMTGILNAVGAAAVYQLPAGIVTLEQMTNEHFRKAISMLPGKYRKDAGWFCNSTVYDGAMAPILDAAGGNSQADLENGPGRMKFKGYPVAETQNLVEAVDVAANSKPIIFGNLKAGAILGDRRQLRVQASDQAYWDTDEIGIKGTARFQAKIHKTGDAAKVGAFVVIQMAAA